MAVVGPGHTARQPRDKHPHTPSSSASTHLATAAAAAASFAKGERCSFWLPAKKHTQGKTTGRCKQGGRKWSSIEPAEVIIPPQRRRRQKTTETRTPPGHNPWKV